QRILTWTFSKIIRTIAIVFFVTVSLLLTGLSVVGAFQMVLVLFANDFVTLSLSTDSVRWSEKPDTWNIARLVKTAGIIGIMLVLEHLGLLYLGLEHFDLRSDIDVLHTFTFEMFFYSGILTVLTVRERGHFWDSMPSTTLLAVSIAEMIAVGVIATIGIPGLKAMPIAYTLTIVSYYLVLALLVNDAVKYRIMRVPSAKYSAHPGDKYIRQ
ncbi:MAG: plasma-membrane proton-efflux P-type ATPase, partial [Chloroflexi bacterium]|nr:plasma-membrane proton-efflux P-type ATPase [Chloroflexota bacterium]